jgi:hypothetical protein
LPGPLRVHCGFYEQDLPRYTYGEEWYVRGNCSRRRSRITLRGHFQTTSQRPGGPADLSAGLVRGVVWCTYRQDAESAQEGRPMSWLLVVPRFIQAAGKKKCPVRPAIKTEKFACGRWSKDGTVVSLASSPCGGSMLNAQCQCWDTSDAIFVQLILGSKSRLCLDAVHRLPDGKPKRRMRRREIALADSNLAWSSK